MTPVNGIARGLTYPFRLRSPKRACWSRLIRSAQSLTYPHAGIARDSALIRGKSEMPPNLSLLNHAGDGLLRFDWRRVLLRARFTAMTNDPVLIAYAVKRAPSSGKPVWTRIGAAYPHQAGAGLTVVLNAMPFDGRVVLLERTDEDDDRIQRRLTQLAREV